MSEGGAVPPTNGDTAPVVRTGMLIRRPTAEVFEAFADPAITSRFWFTKGSGRLKRGAQVQWDWEMYGVSAQVSVKEIEQEGRILIEWGSGDESPTTVEWLFTPHADDATFVSITNWGFSGDEDEIARQAIDGTEGFTLVLAGAKALLEHGLALDLVRDRYPTGHAEAKTAQNGNQA